MIKKNKAVNYYLPVYSRNLFLIIDINLLVFVVFYIFYTKI